MRLLAALNWFIRGIPSELNYGGFGSRDSSFWGKIELSKSLIKRLVDVLLAKSQVNKFSEAFFGSIRSVTFYEQLPQQYRMLVR